MLRISITKADARSATLHLEGQLGGAWITELRDMCDRMLGAGRTLALDLRDVSLIERAGFELLASLSRRAVSLVCCSPFQAEQLRQSARAQQNTALTLP